MRLDRCQSFQHIPHHDQRLTVDPGLAHPGGDIGQRAADDAFVIPRGAADHRRRGVRRVGALQQLLSEHWSEAGGLAKTLWLRISESGKAVIATLANLLLIPIVTILIPLIKVVPFLYSWRIRRRIWHWYDELKKLEYAIADAPANQRIEIVEMS